MTEHQDGIPGPEDTTEEEISPAPSPRSSADPLIGTKIEEFKYKDSNLCE